MTDARKILTKQIESAYIQIHCCKARLSELDDRIRRESMDAWKMVGHLEGASIGCHATNIISLGTEMARVCADLQSAQDYKRNAESTLEMLNG